MSIAAVNVKERIEALRARVQAAAERSGRNASEITVVAVTKGVMAARALEACEAGLSIFGENKVQEAIEKIPAVNRSEIQWHMIGHLQSNKVKAAVNLFHLIQSVDTVRLAEKINAEAALEQKVMPVLLEVNVAGDPDKYGFSPEEIYNAIEAVGALPNIRVEGLMGMAPESDPEGARACFKKLKGLYIVCKGMKKSSPNVQMKYLSMGMSDDFEIAIEEGSNMVRVGRALFR